MVLQAAKLQSQSLPSIPPLTYVKSSSLRGFWLLASPGLTCQCARASNTAMSPGRSLHFTLLFTGEAPAWIWERSRRSLSTATRHATQREGAADAGGIGRGGGGAEQAAAPEKGS